ncbi:hypothetical protein [Candidatus Avelusimicrobium caledoniensis]|uniref:hypothetical protein n=1 Tax=Candidatus Avelusimicrobium caledoniensis TaxID=3416220 RepID=UPI003D0CC910
MKYVSSLLLILCFCSAQAEAPWGVLDDAVDNHTYGVDKLLAGQPIRYAVSEDITPQEEQIFKANFYQWPRQTLRLIKQQKREKEFEEILPYLTKNLHVQKADKKTPHDVYLYIEPDENKKPDALGFYEHRNRHIAVIAPYRDAFASTTLHEIGHFYGLGDQYDKEHHNSSQQYSNNGHRESIMSARSVFTCDDADGFANLIALRLSQQGRQIRLPSLCPHSQEVYQNAQPLTRENRWRAELKEGNLFALFKITNSEININHDKASSRITSVYSRYGIDGLCPLRDQFSFRNFKVSDDRRYLHIWCNRGTKESKPQWSFPLIYVDDWEIYAYEPLKESNLQGHKKTTVYFKDNKPAQVERQLFISSVWPSQTFTLTRDLEHNAYTLIWKHGVVMGKDSYREEKVSFSVLGNDLRIGMMKTPGLSGPQRKTFLMLQQELDGQVLYTQSFYKNFYRPILEQPQRQQAQQRVARQMKHR